MEFKTLNVRDFTYVFANMRAEDRDELFCQLPEGITHQQAQSVVSSSIVGPSFSAHDRTGPIACFGAAESGISHIFVGWAFGTRRFKRAAPFIGEFMWEVMAPMLVDYGCKRVEVRSKTDHVLASRWLPKLGFNKDAVLKHWARTGDDFNLWSITVRDYHNRNKRVN
jgi:hypothetical protein